MTVGPNSVEEEKVVLLLDEPESPPEGPPKDQAPVFQFVPPKFKCAPDFKGPKCSPPNFEVVKNYEKNLFNADKLPKLPKLPKSPAAVGSPSRETMTDEEEKEPEEPEEPEEPGLPAWYTPDVTVFGQSTEQQRAQMMAKLGEEAGETVIAVAAGMDQCVEAAHEQAPSMTAQEACRSMLRPNETILVDMLPAVALLNVPGSSAHKNNDRFGSAGCALTSEGRLLLASVQDSANVKVDGSFKTAREVTKTTLDDGSSRRVDITGTAMRTTDFYAKSINPTQLIDVDFSQMNQTVMTASEEQKVEGVKAPTMQVNMPKKYPKRINFWCRRCPKVKKCCTGSCCKVKCCDASCCRVKVNCGKLCGKLTCCGLKAEWQNSDSKDKPKIVQNSGTLSGAVNEEQTVSEVKKLVTTTDENGVKQTQVNVLTIRFLDANKQEARELAVVLHPSVDMRKALQMTGALSANCDASALVGKAGWTSIASPFSKLQQLGAAEDISSSKMSMALPMALPKGLGGVKKAKKVMSKMSPKKLTKKIKKTLKKKAKK